MRPFSPSMRWVPGTKPNLSGLAAVTFVCHLASPHLAHVRACVCVICNIYNVLPAFTLALQKRAPVVCVICNVYNVLPAFTLALQKRAPDLIDG